MRRLPLACLPFALIAAGCMGAPEETPSPPSAAAPALEGPGSDPAPDAGLDAPLLPVGPRSEPFLQTFYLTSDYALSPTPPAEGKVPERIEPGGFARYVALGPMVPVWEAPALRTAMEIVGEVVVTLSFTSESPGTTATDPAFASVGGWFGGTDRWDFFMQGTDAPKTLDAGKVYTVTMRHDAPPGGWFLRPGEPFAAHPYLAYHTAQPVSYLVGGATPSTVSFRAVTFNLSALKPVEVVSETGEVSPNANPASSEGATTDVPFTLAPGTVYAVVELEAAPSPPAQRIDADLAVVAKSGGAAGSSHGPTAREVVVVGPGQLALGNGEYVAKIAASASGPGTFTLKVTAYAP